MCVVSSEPRAGKGVYTHRFKDDHNEGADVAAVGHLGTGRGR